MDGIDASTWQALGLTLSALGLLLSVVLWRRRGPASGLRGTAWSLLPAAAGLTGTLRLLWQIGDSVVSWALRLVFNPVVWVGLLLAGVSVVLFGVSSAMRSRGFGSKGRSADRRSKEAGPKDDAQGELPSRRSRGKAEPAVQDKDMDDIEAILRKHGIS